MTRQSRYTIKQVADMAGVSVRTLHHYDQFGLLKPSAVGENGYRYYDRENLLQLQHILMLRELDFPLMEIKKLVDHKADRVGAYEEHRRQLMARQVKLARMIQTLDDTIAMMKGYKQMDDQDLLADFSDEKLAEYQEEAKQRWGNTEAWRQSQGKWERLTKDQQEDMKLAQINLQKRFAQAMETGKPVDSPEVQELIKEHRAGINFFYDCSNDMYAGLANMYVADPRFAHNYDRFAPGLAEFVRQAMLASVKVEG